MDLRSYFWVTRCARSAPSPWWPLRAHVSSAQPALGIIVAILALVSVLSIGGWVRREANSRAQLLRLPYMAFPCRGKVATAVGAQIYRPLRPPSGNETAGVLAAAYTMCGRPLGFKAV